MVFSLPIVKLVVPLARALAVLGEVLVLRKILLVVGHHTLLHTVAAVLVILFHFAQPLSWLGAGQQAINEVKAFDLCLAVS